MAKSNFIFYRMESFVGGLNLTSPSLISPGGGMQSDQCIEAINCDFVDGKSIQNRFGYDLHVDNTYPEPIWGYKYSSHGYGVNIVMTQDFTSSDIQIWKDTTEVYSASAGFSTIYWSPEVYGDELFLVDPLGADDHQKAHFDVPYALYDIGMTAPADACSGTVVASSGNLDGNYYYYYTHISLDKLYESALSPISGVFSCTNEKVNLTDIADAAETGENAYYKYIYRTGGTLSTINYVGWLASGTTTFEDNIADLNVGSVCTSTDHNVLGNARILKMFNHQMFAAHGGYLYYSKFYLPYAFPSSYYIEVPKGTIMGLMEINDDLIVYTNRTIYRLRSIGVNEGDTVLEEISNVALLAPRTLCQGVDPQGKTFHIFLGSSSTEIGIFIFDGYRTYCISEKIKGKFNYYSADITNRLGFSYVEYSCAFLYKGKYWLSYPIDEQYNQATIVTDLNSPNAKFSLSTITFNAAYLYDYYYLFFGGQAKQIYQLDAASSDYISNTETGIAVTYQTPYFGDPAQYSVMTRLRFWANTQGETLTIKVYSDYTLVETLTTSTSSFSQIDLTCSNACIGHVFSIRFEITAPTDARIKISPPLECQFTPFQKG